MYEQFTDRARKTMRLAEDEARRLRHEGIGTEHILLGLLMLGKGVAFEVLKNLEVDRDELRVEIERIAVAATTELSTGRLPLTPRGKRVIEYATYEASTLRHHYVGTEHLLLGLLAEPEGPGGFVVRNAGVISTEARNEVQGVLGYEVNLPSLRSVRTPLPCSLCAEEIKGDRYAPCRVILEVPHAPRQVLYFHAECYRTHFADDVVLKPKF